MIVKTNPKNGYASLSVANISVLGYDADKLPDNFASGIMSLAAPYVMMDGMNEMGFSIGVLLIKDEPTQQNTDQAGSDYDLGDALAFRQSCQRRRSDYDA